MKIDVKTFTPEMTPTEKGNAKRIKGYEIAKAVGEVASTYAEAMEILGYAIKEFETAIQYSEPEIADGPRDRWGERIMAPGNNKPGAMEQGIMEDLQRPRCQ